MDSEFSSCDILESMLEYGSSGPLNLPLDYLRNITNNFSDERLLGGGGFGKVYKGVLPNGETIAVKKLNSSMPEDKQFKNEAYHLMRLKHPNIVLLVGYCSETKETYVEYNGKYIWAEKLERLLCLEYMPKGNLREYLSDESSGLAWETRYKIIEGICYGLHYLHGEWKPNVPIIHLDLKPANILLDNNMVPKIADFGLSRLFSEGKTRTCASRDGTLGYMAPEYINKGLISTKSDIFSLGVIIIEIVTGQRDYPDETGISSQEFTELVLKNWRDRLQKSLRYTSLVIDYQQIRRCIQVGLDCVKLDRWKRPTISQVIKMLHGTESVDFSDRKAARRYLAVAGLELDRPASLALAGSAPCSLFGAGSKWDVMRSFTPDQPERAPASASRPARRFGQQDAVNKDEENAVEDPSLGESFEFWTATSSLSSSNTDEASSRTTESMFYISPNRRSRRRIWSWSRGLLLGSGSFGTPIWKFSSKGGFTIKSTCNALTINDSGFYHKKIWKGKIPAKIKIFLWHILNNAVLTKDNMNRRNRNEDPSCNFCTAPETATHLFFQCSIAKLVWATFAVYLGATDIPSHFQQCWDWCEKWIPAGKQFHTLGIAAVCWAIWKTKNTTCFENKAIKNSITIICHACALMKYWAGLYMDEDRDIIVEGVNTMLRTGELMSKKNKKGKLEVPGGR